MGAQVTTLRFGLKLSGQDTTIDELRSIWRLADEAGFDHVWDFDHLAAIGDGGADRSIFEGWTLLAAMAEATERVRIGCMVTGNTYRHPVLLAKQAVTVDHLSRGRLEFGIGAAWAQIEHQMYGIEGLDHRVGRLSESLQILRSLWTAERTDFEGRYYTLTDAIANPKPVQQPHPPIWIGAGGPTTMKLVARHADVWNVTGASGAEAAGELSRRLDEECAQIGRAPSDVRRSAQVSGDVGRAELLDLVGSYVRQGFTELVLYLRGGDPVRSGEAVAEALPQLRSVS